MGPRMKGLILWKIQHLSDFFAKTTALCALLWSFVRLPFKIDRLTTFGEFIMINQARH